MAFKFKNRKVKMAEPLAEDFYVVHTTHKWQCHTYASFKDAYDTFKMACKCSGPAAMWRGPNWVKLYEHGEYPNVKWPREFLDPRGNGLENYVGNPLEDESSKEYFDRYIAGDR